MFRRQHQHTADEHHPTDSERLHTQLEHHGGWLFEDRADAGRQLAERLGALDPNTVVIGIPRGGVPVAAVVAHHFGLPLDVVIVRKLGTPGHHELALGAVGEGGITVVSEPVVRQFGIDPDRLRSIEGRERLEVQRRETQIRSVLDPIGLTGRSVLIVDDGVATGSTLLAACRVVRSHEPQRIIVAVPVAPPGWKLQFGDAADAYMACFTPEDFMAVGQWYRSFPPVEDDEMLHDLLKAREAMGRPGDLITMPSSQMPSSQAQPTRVDTPADPPTAIDEELRVPSDIAGTDGEPLLGYLSVPAGATGLVVFAHGSGSGRMSPRNLEVAATFNERGLGTLVVDLLSVSEQADHDKAFDIDLLAGRVGTICRHLQTVPSAAHLSIALFGGSTGAAAALQAAAADPDRIVTVVARGGRIDLAAGHLDQVRCPVLLVVGGHDEWVLTLNQRAMASLPEGSELEVVPGASHLFSEPGALERVATLAADWFSARWQRHAH